MVPPTSYYHLTNPNLAFHDSDLILLRHELLLFHNLLLACFFFSPLIFTNIVLLMWKVISTCCSFPLPQPIFSVLADWQSEILCLWMVIEFQFSNTVPYSFLPINLFYSSFSLSLPHTFTPGRNLILSSFQFQLLFSHFSSCSDCKCTPAELGWNMLHLKTKLPKSTWPGFQQPSPFTNSNNNNKSIRLRSYAFILNQDLVF